MTRHAAALVRTTLPVLVAGLALVASVACDGNGGPRTTGSVLVLTCTPDASSVSAGNATGVGVTVTLTRNGLGLPGRTLSVATTAGTVMPTAGVTDADGSIRVQFFPPSVAGTVILTSQVIDGPAMEQVTTSCVITVVGAADPQVVVTLLAPAQLAGLTVVVGYDPVGLAVTSVQPVGGLAGTDCLTDSNVPGNGQVTIIMACPSVRAVGGAEVARVSFDNVDGEIHDAGDFTVACSGVDVFGAPVGTACSHAVTQL